MSKYFQVENVRSEREKSNPIVCIDLHLCLLDRISETHELLRILCNLMQLFMFLLHAMTKSFNGDQHFLIVLQLDDSSINSTQFLNLIQTYKL